MEFELKVRAPCPPTPRPQLLTNTNNMKFWVRISLRCGSCWKWVGSGFSNQENR